MVINDGYLAQVPEGDGAHLHSTDRYNTALQDQTGQDRTGLQQAGEQQTGVMSVTAPPPATASCSLLLLPGVRCLGQAINT